ncbi:hypothetical protein [Flagellimonas sp. S3867]|uniref:hypothetical protein n=1 Tax=Flagellimonas sp. S3867 TaxID=2768063 RepID=UPI0016836A66|nr:hypothetical protein [Flagellimonas sp. S3867]
MHTEDFVRGVHQTKEELLKTYFNDSIETYVGEQIKSLGFNPKQLKNLRAIIDGALTDGFYSLLIGLEGGASIGGNLQQAFKLFDEENNSLTEDIGSLAYEYFQED